MRLRRETCHKVTKQEKGVEPKQSIHHIFIDLDDWIWTSDPCPRAVGSGLFASDIVIVGQSLWLVAELLAA